MSKQKVLIIGSGHLEYRVKKQLESHDYEVASLPYGIFESNNKDGSRFDHINEVLKDVDLASVTKVCVLDDSDAFNLEIILFLISINKELPIFASLFNENITPHLQAAHPNIEIFNPAKIVAPTFIKALDAPIEHTLHYKIPNRGIKFKQSNSDRLLRRLVVFFLFVFSSGTIYFHFAENLSWINAIYFMVVTVGTVGYGDINLLNSSTISKTVGVIVIICSTLCTWLIFSLIIDGLVKKRLQRFLGRKQYKYKNHVILSGLGRLGYQIGKELIASGEKIIIIEENEHSPYLDYFRENNIDVYIGDARRSEVLQDVGVARAKAIISVINNDLTNLEIGLNARSFGSQLRLILRIFDESMSLKIKENLDIHITLSMSAIASESFVKTLNK